MRWRGEHGPQVPHLHGHLGVLGEAREGQGAVEVLDGAVELPGIDQGPRGRRGEVAGERVQTLPHALGGGLVLQADRLVGPGQGGLGEAAVPAAVGVQRDQSLDVVPQPDHVKGAHTRGAGRGSGHHGSGSGAGGRAAELTTAHVGVLR
ncbi:hypothetical protein AB0L74_33925 [Streptomyces sp. NPDC052020]|uniref:hypothetical protein n=1 Tax=Streptomyces sp. NPDC052020 TaxID=3155677 RepID=UPI0034342954